MLKVGPRVVILIVTQQIFCTKRGNRYSPNIWLAEFN